MTDNQVAALRDDKIILGGTTMAEVTGSEILAKCLKKEGTKDLFYIMGGPMQLCQTHCAKEEIRMIDVRHEQAAALSAQAYSRLLQKPGVCMAASGPGVDQPDDRHRQRAHRLRAGRRDRRLERDRPLRPADVPGDRPGRDHESAAPSGRTASINIKRIPEQVNNAFQKAMSGKPGPVYLDFPADVLYEKVDEAQVDWRLSGRPLLNPRPLGEQAQVDELIDALSKAKQPLVVSGSGVIWSQAWTEMQTFVEKAGIPFYTTPQGRGVVPDDHPLSFLTMRSTAFKDADLIIILGTRMNYIIGHGAPPRFGGNAKIARIDIDARRARHGAAQDRHPDPRRLQGGAPAADRRAAEARRAGELRAVAQEARRRRSRRRRRKPAAACR